MSDVGLSTSPARRIGHPGSARGPGSRPTTASAATSSSCSAARGRQLAGHPGHERRPVGLDRVDEQPQRHADAGVPDDARRGGDRGARRSRAGVDLPERVYPADLVVPVAEEARRRKNERRLAALGIARQRTRELPASWPTWRPASRTSRGGREGRVARRAVAPRRRLRGPNGAAVASSTGSSTTASEPSSCSTSSTPRCTSPPPSAGGATTAPRSSTAIGWSGKVDAAADRKASVLRVNAIHAREAQPHIWKAVQAELDDLAAWLGLVAVEPAR